DGDDAVDVGVAAQEAGVADPLGDVLVGAGRAVDGADDGDVVARAVAPVAAVVAHPGALPGGRGRRRRTRGAEGVVALEGVGRDVVDVDVVAGGDVRGGEADDLAVLADRLALADGAQGDLVAEADAAADGEGVAVAAEL